MNGSHATRRVRRWIVATGVAVASLGFAGVAAAAGESTTSAALLGSLRSVAHISGIVFSVLLIYYAVKARRRFAGGVFGESAAFVIAGGVLFAIAFLFMELGHGFGFEPLSLVDDMHMRMGIQMLLFSGTVFAFGWGFYRMASVLGGRGS